MTKKMLFKENWKTARGNNRKIFKFGKNKLNILDKYKEVD